MSDLKPQTLAGKRLALQRRQAGQAPTTLVPIGPVVAHLQHLRAWGMSIDSITATSGVSRAVLATLLGNNTRQQQHVMSTTAAKILATRPSPDRLPPKARVNSIGAARRIRSLTAIGWSLSEISRRTGMPVAFVHVIAHQRTDRLNAATHRRIADLYARLETTSGTSKRARNLAARHGWPVPAAWGHDSIDDPDALPQHDVRLTREQVRVEALRLIEAGETVQDVAEQLGCSVRTVERAIQRAEQEVA